MGYIIAGMRLPDGKVTRADALSDSWLCGMVLGSVGMAFHHKLCHTLGGMFNLPYAVTHTIVLPHAVAYNADAASHVMEHIAQALQHRDAAQGAYEFAPPSRY